MDDISEKVVKVLESSETGLGSSVDQGKYTEVFFLQLVDTHPTWV